MSAAKERVGAFVDACIDRPDEARRMAAAEPTLLQATWAGDPLLHWFVVEDFAAAVQLVLELGFPVELRDKAGRTALIAACAAGRLGCARILLAHGADPNAGNEHFGENALHCAVVGESIDVASLLLSRGARGDYFLGTHDTVFHAMRGWLPEVRPLFLDELKRHGVTRESVFAKHLAGIYESMEQAFDW